MKITKFGMITCDENGIVTNDFMFEGREPGEENSLSKLLQAVVDYVRDLNGPDLVVVPRDEYERSIY